MLLLILCLIGTATATETSTCERAPPHAQPADAFYKLSIAGDPDLFLPGELYTVSLQGIDSGQGPTPFSGFMIWAELEDAESDGNKTEEASKQSSGVFQVYDTQAKPHESCTTAIANATSHPKTDIQVIWTAPTALDLCVRICGRASQTEGAVHPSILARKLCPAPVTTNISPRQPPIIEPCCACDEAKYEVTFEGLWSRNTHPREFPPESARAHFGDMIGATHTAQYRVWQEGRIASTGLRRLADDGTTTALEKELKSESEHIRTIIKARGISWQQVAGAGIPSTFAVFRVDAKHHLVSLAAKLAPSPDWIVGVSALELCNSNCTWRQSATLPLYPYDAGTDNGITYISRRHPTIPQAPVRALRPDWPRDVRSPFYSTSGEMRPFARLRLTRLRLYEKSCDAVEPGVEKVVESTGVSGGCTVLSWGAWGPCSVTCGEGKTSRQRHYLWPARARSDGCRLPLTDYKPCRGPRMHCRVIGQYEPDPAEATGPCAVSDWSEWSPCEGCGVRARTRHYIAPRAFKRCHQGFRARTVLSQAMPCDAGPCYKPPNFINATNFDWFYIDNPRGSCKATSWSMWSPCSARCGRGRRLRTRILIARESRLQQVLTRRLIFMWNKRFAELQNLETPVDDVSNEDPEIEALVQEYLDSCQFTMTQQEALCDGEDASCINTTLPHDHCILPRSVGPCRGYDERWFFDAETRVCEPFGYTGCGGNSNNFKTRESCEKACKHEHEPVPVTTQLPETSTKRMKATPSNEDNEVLQNDVPLQDVNCEMGPWLGWGECFGDCDVAVKLNYRLIIRPASGEGKICHKVVKSRPCKPAHCKKIITNSTDIFEVIDRDD